MKFLSWLTFLNLWAAIPGNLPDIRYFHLGSRVLKTCFIGPKNKVKKSNMPILSLKGPILKIAYLFSSEIV